ncbi:hypothetical protein [Salinigranum salinum]|uniref:hypothetical protein n=1 Tax=Salinigranum salinum TaxID=1364937 RepID=UPI0012606D5A|nr:hypothetical protein [Salinigranum salinum]
MSVPSRAAFARRFRDQPPATQAAFVAALFAAGGWETSREGRVIRVEKGGTTRLMSVAVAGTPSDPVDDLVVPFDTPAVRERAREVNARVVGPDDLRNRLLYGLDRETANAVYRDQFGLDLTEEEPGRPPGTRTDTGDAGGGDPEGTDSASRSAAATADGDDGRGDARDDSSEDESGASDDPDEDGNGSDDREDARSADGDERSADGDERSASGDERSASGDERSAEDRRSLAGWWDGAVLGLVQRPRTERVRPGLVAASVGVAVLGLGVVVVLGGLAGSAPIDEGADPVVDASTIESAGLKPGSWAALAESDARLVDPPPGLSEDAVTDVDALVDAHVAAAGRGPSSTVVTVSGPRRRTSLVARQAALGDDDESRVELHVDARGNYRYRVDRTTAAESGNGTTTYRLDAYGDAGGEYRRTTVDGVTTYRHVLASDRQSGSDRLAALSRAVIGTSLNTPDSRVERVTLDGTVRYRVTATGQPAEFAGETNDYRATTTVTPEGLVTDLSARYQHPSTGSTVRIDVTHRPTEDEPLTPPAWVAEAQNETARRVGAEPVRAA